MLYLEIKKILKRKEFIFVAVMMFATVIIDFLVNCYNYFGCNMSELYPAYTMTVLDNISREPFRIIFVIALPLLASIVASDIYLTDKNLQRNTYIITRINRKKYIKTQAFAIFLVVSLVTLAALLLNVLFCIIAFPMYGNRLHGMMFPMELVQYQDGAYIQYQLFEKLRLYHPYLNLLFFVVMRSIIAGIFALVSYGISFINKMNRYVVFVSSFFIYSIVDFLEGFLDSKLFDWNMSDSIWKYFAYSGIFSVNPAGNIVTYLKDILLFFFIFFVTIKFGMKKEEL